MFGLKSCQILDCLVKNILKIRFVKQLDFSQAKSTKQQKIRCEQHDTWQANKLPYDFYTEGIFFFKFLRINYISKKQYYHNEMVGYTEIV